MGECTLEVQNFVIDWAIKIDHSETTTSHMFNTSLKLTNYK